MIFQVCKKSRFKDGVRYVCRLFLKNCGSIGAQLEELYRERQKVERDIQRIPQEESLKPFLEKLQQGRERFSRKAEEVGEIADQNGALDQKLQRADAEYRRSAETVKSASSQRVALERAGKTQVVLREFREALIEQKVRAVEKELTYCYGLLSRKKVRDSFRSTHHLSRSSLKDEHVDQCLRASFLRGKADLCNRCSVVTRDEWRRVLLPSLSTPRSLVLIANIARFSSSTTFQRSAIR